MNTTQPITMGHIEGLRTDQERDYIEAERRRFIRAVRYGESGTGLSAETLQGWMAYADDLSNRFALNVSRAFWMGQLQEAERLHADWIHEAANHFAASQAGLAFLQKEVA